MTESQPSDIPVEPQLDVKEEVPVKPSDASSERASDPAENTSELVPEQTSDSNPEQTSELIPEQISASTQEQTSELVPEQTSDLIPEQTSDSNPEQTSELILEQASELIPEQTSELVPEQTSDSNPEQTSDPISPEQIPENHYAPSQKHTETADIIIEQSNQLASTETPDVSKVIPDNDTTKHPGSTDDDTTKHPGSTDDGGFTVTVNLGASEDKSDRKKEAESMDNSSTELLECEKEILDPVVEKLILFLKNSSQRDIEFAGDISSHEMFLVHRFVQEHGLTCESTGNNANHKFVVAKGDGFEPDDGGEEMQDGDEKDDQDSLDDDFVELDSNIEDTDTSDTNQGFWFTRSNKGAVNRSLTLEALKLDNFSGIYKTGNYKQLVDSIQKICQAVGVPFRFEENFEKSDMNSGSKRNFRVSFYMNDVHVSDGYSDKLWVAKQNALQAAYLYLRRNLRLTLSSPSKCQFRRVKMNFFGNNQKYEHKYKDCFRNYLEQEFLAYPDLAQLRVVGSAKSNLNDENHWQRKISVEVAHQFKLQTDIIKNRFLYVTKVNSILHKIRVIPYQDQQPYKRLKLRRNPPNERTTNHTEQNAHVPASSNVTDQTHTERPLSWKQIMQDGWDPSKVNVSLKHVRLVKLDKFHGVILRHLDGPKVIKEIAKSLGVSCKFKFANQIPKSKNNRWRGTLFLNNIYIAEDIGGTTATVISNIANNALPFLISKGLKVIFEDEICDGQTKEVYREDVASSSYQQQFSSFLQDEMLLMMKFCFPPTYTEKELIVTMCESHSLDFRCEGGISPISVLKRNSRLHKMVVTRRANNDCTPSSRQSAIVVTTEDLASDPSIRKHVDKFVECDSLKEITFPDNLEGIQRELIEVLAEKHKLQLEYNRTGKIVLFKLQIGTQSPQESPKRIKKPKWSKEQKAERDVMQLSSRSRGTKRLHPADLKNITITKTFRTDRNDVQEGQGNGSFTCPFVGESSRYSVSRNNSDTLLDSSYQPTCLNHTQNIGSASHMLFQNRNRSNIGTSLNSFNGRRPFDQHSVQAYHDNVNDDMELDSDSNDPYSGTSRSMSPSHSNRVDNPYYEDSPYSSASPLWHDSFPGRQGKYRQSRHRM